MNKDSNFIVNMNGQKKNIPLAVLKEFSESIGMNHCIEGRYSWLFAIDLFMYGEMRVINPLQVMDEVKSLENSDSRSRTKPETQFRKPPLKGLWHKHYPSARFIAQNIKNHLSGNKLTELVKQTLEGKDTYDDALQIAYELSHKVVSQSYDERAQSGKLTGEWIIFAKHNNENYYLSMATHDMGDELAHERIKTICYPQFPFLKGLMDQ